MYNSLAKEVREIMNWLDWDSGSYVYQRPVIDSRPYQIIREDQKSHIIFNALGVSNDDISVKVIREHGKDFLTIDGESKHETLGKTFSVSGKFSLDGECVDSIEYEVINGLLDICVNFKTPEPSKIEIKRK